MPSDDVDEQATSIVYYPSGVAGTHILLQTKLSLFTL